MYEKYETNIDHLVIYFNDENVAYTKKEGRVLCFYDKNNNLIGIEIMKVSQIIKPQASELPSDAK